MSAANVANQVISEDDFPEILHCDERHGLESACDDYSIAREPIEPYTHNQNGLAERANRTIRERPAPMVQEASISGQVSKIISEKGTELLRIPRIPENLWPEATTCCLAQEAHAGMSVTQERRAKPREVTNLASQRSVYGEPGIRDIA